MVVALMYVGHLRDACRTTGHIRDALVACRAVHECHTFACTWSETETRTRTWRYINTTVVSPSWKCLYDVMPVIDPRELDVNSQTQTESALWGKTNVAVIGVEYNLLAMNTCMNFVNAHGQYDAVYRMRFDVPHRVDFARSVSNRTIRSESAQVKGFWNTHALRPDLSISISHVVNNDNLFWGSQQTMTTLLKTWQQYVVYDSVSAQKINAMHPEHAMCVAGASKNISIQIPYPYGPSATLRCA